MKYFFVKTSLLGSEIIRNVYADMESALSKLIDKYVENDNTPFNFIDAYCGYYYVIEVADSVDTITDYVKATSDIYRIYIKDELVLISKRDKTTYKTNIHILVGCPNTLFRLQTLNNLYKKDKSELLNEYRTFVSKDNGSTTLNAMLTLYSTLIKGVYQYRVAEFETQTYFLY